MSRWSTTTSTDRSRRCCRITSRLGGFLSRSIWLAAPSWWRAATRSIPPAAKRCSNQSITWSLGIWRGRWQSLKTFSRFIDSTRADKRSAEMSSKSFAERIADVLIEDGLLLPNQLEEAVTIQKTEGGRLLKILTDRQFVTEQDMAFSMGRCLNTPPVNLTRLRVPDNVMSLVPREMAKVNKLVPIAHLNGKLFVAMADPTNVLAIDDLKRRVQLEIVPMIATEQAVNDALSGIHTSSANMSQVLKKAAEEAAQTSEVEVHAAKHEEIDLDRLAADSEDAPVIKIVNLILVQAMKEKASDIHIEPFQNSLKLRYRSEGEWVRAEPPRKALQPATPPRKKPPPALNTADPPLPQDGRFRIKVMGKEVDLRISILPTAHGEKIVIRILDKASLTGGIEQMGIDHDTLKKFRKASSRWAST